ncbi:NAD(P)/FAD-dependent oxidoreductase [Microbacterium immunditiarum]|uniref:Thioredoxin reductase n=1 Tax=Microbacterium immunditiarum TaxID=337480 RepID=A0A7Y9GNZ4_9MICO|nr:NAD(P)/FAD-dependent oxidoreductase [Microbacterium immunditiarum]NYE20028.1 thioredoxin reductase [Microbacterium immunditiarum]
MEQWDAIVIGAGAAGLSAAQMLGRSRRRTLVVDAGAPRNRFAEHMHGVLGQDGTPPTELLARGRAELDVYGVVVRGASVVSVVEDSTRVSVWLDDGSEHAGRALVVATGVRDELPDLPGLAERWGRSVLHCPFCHGWEVRDQRLGVLLLSPLQLHQAQLVRQLSDDVTVFAGALGALDPAVEQRWRARGMVVESEPVVELLGDAPDLTGVRLRDGRTVGVDAIFTVAAPRPLDVFLVSLGLDRAETPHGSFLAVDAAGRTSSRRIWAAGNVVNPMANVPQSMGAGAMAGAAAHGALVEEDFALAVAGSISGWASTAEGWSVARDATWRTRSALPISSPPCVEGTALGSARHSLPRRP